MSLTTRLERILKSPLMSQIPDLSPNESWADILETLQELSLQTDPQKMVQSFSARMRTRFPAARYISLSRRGLSDGQFRITRHSDWDEEINPWKQQEKLPLLSGGLLGQLIYSNRPQLLNDVHISPDDPAAPFLAGTRSVVALPQYDQGLSLNMAVATENVPHAFDPRSMPERIWLASLFGRANHNLVLARQLDEAYRAVDHELQIVADIQRSLLPKNIPAINTLRVAHHYETSRRAGGDYYDFFRLPNNRWGFLIADVSGHGTPAAVVMAILHSIAHMYPGEPLPPSQMLAHLNQHLTDRYTSESGHFVTAFYAIYDDTSRELTFSSAGHNPPRLHRRGQSRIESLDQAASLPLGIMSDISFENHSLILQPGDRLALYTDGITEASVPGGELFGNDRFDAELLTSPHDPEAALNQILSAINQFTKHHPPSDDRTLLVANVT